MQSCSSSTFFMSLYVLSCFVYYLSPADLYYAQYMYTMQCIKDDLDKRTVHPKFDPDQGSNSWLLDHDSIFHFIEVPALTT